MLLCDFCNKTYIVFNDLFLTETTYTYYDLSHKIKNGFLCNLDRKEDLGEIGFFSWTLLYGYRDFTDQLNISSHLFIPLYPPATIYGVPIHP